jgi:hypothetical protein
MDNKSTMLEAVKRKRYQIQQHEEDQTGEDSEGQSARMGDDELAPVSGSHQRDALLGKPETEGEPGDVKDESHQNQTELGKQGGFNKLDKAGAPENSKNLFHDPKKDTHDAVDLNKHRNMAGDGSNSKYDKMGVNEHKDVRLQSSNLAKKNAIKAEAIKGQSRKSVKSSMDIADNEPSHGEDVQDAVKDNQQQPGFAAPHSKVNGSGSKSQEWDQDKEGASGSGGLYADNDGDGEDEEDSDTAPSGARRAMKKARGKLEGFLSKMKS